MVELLRGGFDRISDGGIAARVLWTGKLRLYFFFTRVFVINDKMKRVIFLFFSEWIGGCQWRKICERGDHSWSWANAGQTTETRPYEISNFKQECITIASACNVAYRKNWMPENKIAVEPVRGWRPKHNQSRIFYTCVCDKMT